MTSPGPPPNRRRQFIVAGIVLTASVFLTLAYRLRPLSINELKAQATGIINSLERYREEHGEYPESAARVGVKLPKTVYGSWRYRVGDDRKWFELSVGDYTGFNPFTLYWSSKSGHWSEDR